MTTTITRKYLLNSGHHLPNVPPGHKCGRPHGHTYHVEVGVSGPIDTTLGWVMDFAMLDAIVQQLVVSKLDHYTLNDIEGLENPTSENLAKWIFDRMSICVAPHGAWIARVAVSENPHSNVEYTG